MTEVAKALLFIRFSPAGASECPEVKGYTPRQRVERCAASKK